MNVDVVKGSIVKKFLKVIAFYMVEPTVQFATTKNMVEPMVHFSSANNTMEPIVHFAIANTQFQPAVKFMQFLET